MTEFLPSEFFDLRPTTLDTLREDLRLHMDMLGTMDVREHTLYKKWLEVQKFSKQINLSQVVKAKIWVPIDIFNEEQTVEEIRALRPKIRYIDPTDSASVDEWLMLRTFSHSMSFDQNLGRFLRFLIYDEVTDKFLGAASIGSDVISVAARDKWIGWTKEKRITAGGPLNNSSIGTCIMSCQPLGYNMLGGKLIASLLLDKEIRNAWKSVTGNTLAGLTTTSLYGSNSMYNGIPYWKKLGVTTGKIFLKPDDSVYGKWHKWLKENKPDVYEKTVSSDNAVGIPTGIKQKILTLMFQTAGLKASKYVHGFQRGVYYGPIYTNTREFLRGEISEDELVEHPRTAGKSTEAIVDWWRDKAINRYRNVLFQDRIKPEILYYNDIIGVSWDEAKRMYLDEIGR